MNEAVAGQHERAAPRSAGSLLRAARQAQGLHIAALAASIKVTPRKLELLESDQFDQLTDATFTRALAQTVCRSLKIDPAPVLALLPPLLANRLDHVAEGLNTPFHERSGRLVDQEWLRVPSPVWWIVLALLLGAIAIYRLPAHWLPSLKPVGTRSVGEASAPRADMGSTDAGDQASAADPSARRTEPSATMSASSEPPVAITPSLANAATPPGVNASVAAPRLSSGIAPELPSPAASGVLQVRATATSWLDVTDARGQTLIARLVQPNESVAIDGVAPFKLKVGNAGATTVVFRGEPVELGASTRDNVARLVLK